MLILSGEKTGQEKNPLSLSSIVLLYRYITFVTVSLVYLLGKSTASSGMKLMVVICTGVACVLLNHLYPMCSGEKGKVLLLLLLETLFNAYILIPSGGLSSPYIWYSLNTIIIAAISLDAPAYCWINLFIYLIGSILAVSSWLSPKINVLLVIEQQANFMLSLLLITGIIQLLSSYAKKLREKNQFLESVNHKVVMSNEKIKESMSYIMELYQAVHLLTSQKDEMNLTRILLEYAAKMTHTRTFLIRNNKIYSISGNPYGLSEKALDGNQIESVRRIGGIKSCKAFKYSEKRYVLAPIRCHYKLHGLLGAELSNLQMEEKDITDLLRFLSEVGTLVLEKFELEKVNRSLLISEEQNRIANEIHDGVLQSLFNLSCGINNLMKQAGSIGRNNLAVELAQLRSSVNSTMSDLRRTIYGYSWKKGGVNSFLTDIENYIETIRKFHGASIQFDLKGNHEMLSLNQKKTIYRIISEAAGNSIKHGKATQIDIWLDIGSFETSLSITDNGSGFDMNILDQESKMGLGIRNIHFLTHSLDGSIQLISKTGKGTSINIRFPLEKKLAFREDAI